MAIDILTSRLYQTLALREFLEKLEGSPYGCGEPEEFRLKQPYVSAQMRGFFRATTPVQRGEIKGYIGIMQACAKRALSCFQGSFIAHLNNHEDVAESHIIDVQSSLQHLDIAYEKANDFFQMVIGPMLGEIDPEYNDRPDKLDIILYEMDQLDYFEDKINVPG